MLVRGRRDARQGGDTVGRTVMLVTESDDLDALPYPDYDDYADDDIDQATRFRRHLDRRLSDRYHTPVAWEVASGEERVEEMREQHEQ